MGKKSNTKGSRNSVSCVQDFPAITPGKAPAVSRRSSLVNLSNKSAWAPLPTPAATKQQQQQQQQTPTSPPPPVSRRASCVIMTTTCVILTASAQPKATAPEAATSPPPARRNSSKVSNAPKPTAAAVRRAASTTSAKPTTATKPTTTPTPTPTANTTTSNKKTKPTPTPSNPSGAKSPPAVQRRASCIAISTTTTTTTVTTTTTSAKGKNGATTAPAQGKSKLPTSTSEWSFADWMGKLGKNIDNVLALPTPATSTKQGSRVSAGSSTLDLSGSNLASPFSSSSLPSVDNIPETPTSQTTGPQGNAKITTSPKHRDAQLEELNALEAIFMTELVIKSRNTPIKLSVSVPLPTLSETPTLLWLEFELPAAYPDKVPVITCSHSLAMSQRAPHMDEAIVKHMRGEAVRLLGDAMVFLLVEAAREFITKHETPAPAPVCASETPASVADTASVAGDGADTECASTQQDDDQLPPAGTELDTIDATSAEQDLLIPRPPALELSEGTVDIESLTVSFAETTVALRRVGKPLLPAIRCSSDLSRLENVRTFATAEIVDDIFDTAPSGQTAPDSANKLKIPPRTLCVKCGRSFPSRGKMFTHLRENPSHDTTPPQLGEILRLCIQGQLDSASEVLWGIPTKAHIVLVTMLLLVAGKFPGTVCPTLRSKLRLVCRTLCVLHTALKEGQNHHHNSPHHHQHHGHSHSDQSRPRRSSGGSEIAQASANLAAGVLSRLVDLLFILTEHETDEQIDSFDTAINTLLGELPVPCGGCGEVFIVPSAHTRKLKWCGHEVCDTVISLATPGASLECSTCGCTLGSYDSVVLPSDSEQAQWLWAPDRLSWKPLSASDSLTLEQTFVDYSNVRHLNIECRAVSLDALVRFTNDHSVVTINGQPRSILDLTTAEVVENVIRPELKRYGKLRYHELIAQDYGRQHVGTVTVFVSHAWANKWALIVKMLVDAFDAPTCRRLRVFFWLDVFAICQIRHTITEKGKLHINDSKECEIANKQDVTAFDHPHRFACRTFGIMNADGLGVATEDLCQRAWCLFEFATTLDKDNVLSFRLGHLRKRNASKSKSASSASNSKDQNTTGTILDDVEVELASSKKFKIASRTIDLRNAKAAVKSDLTDIIQPRVLQLGQGNLFKGYCTVNERVHEAMQQVQDIHEWKDNELSYAAHNGNVEKLRKLLRSGDNPNQPDKAGNTPLHRVCSTTNSNTAACVRALLVAGALPNTPNSGGSTALHLAAQHNRHVSISVLLAHGANPEAINHSMLTALGAACFYGNPLCVTRLLQASIAALEIADRQGRVALHHAALRGNHACVQALLDNARAHLHLDVTDLLGNTPLHLAATGGYRECIRLLLQAGANSTLTNARGYTAADLAARNTKCHELFTVKTKRKPTDSAPMDPPQTHNRHMATSPPPPMLRSSVSCSNMRGSKTLPPLLRSLAVWQWKGDNEEWRPFNEAESTKLECAFRAHPHGQLPLMVGARKYIVNLHKMQQVNEATKFVRPIRRLNTAAN